MESSSMGSFEKLPAELRLLIWGQSLSEGSTSIIATSRAIYDDISGRLYDMMDIHLHPVYDIQWMLVTCRRLSLSWDFQSQKSFPWGMVWNMPYNKVKLAIHVYAPDPQDRSQLILLWMKVQTLVDILQEAPASKSIEIELHPWNGNEWELDAANIKGPLDCRPDYGQDALFAPFCQLNNVRSTTLPYASITTTQKTPSLDSLVRHCIRL